MDQTPTTVDTPNPNVPSKSSTIGTRLAQKLTTVGRTMKSVVVAGIQKLLVGMRHEMSLHLTRGTLIAVPMLFLSSLLVNLGTWKSPMLLTALAAGLLFFSNNKRNPAGM